MTGLGLYRTSDACINITLEYFLMMTIKSLARNRYNGIQLYVQVKCDKNTFEETALLGESQWDPTFNCKSRVGQVMRNAHYAILEQQMCRSASKSMESDLHF